MKVHTLISLTSQAKQFNIPDTFYLYSVSETVNNIGAGQMALLVIKGANLFPESTEKFKGTIDVWWIVHILDHINLTLDLTDQFWALRIQQQINIWCQQYWQLGVQFSDWVENIVGKEEIARYKQFLLFLQCFQKLSVVDALKWVSAE